MGSVSPLTIVLGIVLAVTLTGAVAAFVRDRRRFSGYEDLMTEVIRLARSVRGEVFRDGADLVVSGQWNRQPVLVRFSHAENLPGTNLRMGVPASFTLAIASSRSNQVQGRFPVRTPDEMFNARFTVRSDQPTQAGLFLTGRQVMPALQKLCPSGNSYLLLTIGMAEVSDLSPPDEDSVRRVTEYLEALDQLATELRAMPGADLVKIERLKRERSIALRAAIAVGIVAAGAAIFMAARPAGPLRHAARVRNVPAGVAQSDAARIPRVEEWRLASAEDLDPDGVGWLRYNRQEPAGRIPGDYCGTGPERSVAYLLVKDTSRRLVLLCDGTNVYDVQYPYIGIAARVPKQLFSSINWGGNLSQQPEGDGLLILRAADNPASALVFFITKGRKISSAVPLNYQSIRLE
ncbi:MAG: hypothetical protein ACE14M_03930 [Terriglobales bacterium]